VDGVDESTEHVAHGIIDFLCTEPDVSWVVGCILVYMSKGCKVRSIYYGTIFPVFKCIPVLGSGIVKGVSNFLPLFYFYTVHIGFGVALIWIVRGVFVNRACAYESRVNSITRIVIIADVIFVFIMVQVITVLYRRIEARTTDSTIDQMLVGFIIFSTYREESSIMIWLSPEGEVDSWWKNSIHDKVVVFTIKPSTTSCMINGITTIVGCCQRSVP